MYYKLKALFLDEVKGFINTLGNKDQAKIAATVEFMCTGNFESIHIKKLRNKIKEIIINEHRLIFFIEKDIIYFIGGFSKKSAKTPQTRINNAEKIYKMIIKKI